jgi:hypothetical protein
VRLTHGKKADKPTIDDDEGFARYGYHLPEKRWSLKVALGLVLTVCINTGVAVILWNTYQVCAGRTSQSMAQDLICTASAHYPSLRWQRYGLVPSFRHLVLSRQYNTPKYPLLTVRGWQILNLYLTIVHRSTLPSALLTGIRTTSCHGHMTLNQIIC